MSNRECNGGDLQKILWIKNICAMHSFFLEPARQLTEDEYGLVLKPDRTKWVVRDRAGKVHSIFKENARFYFPDVASVAAFFSGWSAHAAAITEREKLLVLGKPSKREK